MSEYRNPVFEQLLRSGLPIDWTVIRMGWETYDFLIRDQLLDYAMEQLGLCPDDQFDIVSSLAFADPGDTWTLRRCLEQLASKRPDDRDRATRIWRCVLFNDLIQEVEKQVLDAIETPSVDFDEYYSFADYLLEKFYEFDTQFSSLDHNPPIDVSADLPETRDLLRSHRQWLDRERSKIALPGETE